MSRDYADAGGCTSRIQRIRRYTSSMFTAPLPTATRTSIIVERAQALKTLGETYHEDSEDFIQAKKEIMQDTAKRIAAIDKQEKAAKGPSPAQVKQEKYGFRGCRV